MFANHQIVAVVGMPGAGKSTVTKYFAAQGFYRVYFGDRTFEELAKRGLPTNEANEKKIREELRAHYGMAAYARLSMPEITRASSTSHVVIESLYSWEEFRALKDNFPNNFSVLAVQAAPALRYQRISQRIEYQRGQPRIFTPTEIRQREIDQIENLHTCGPIAMADFVVVNEGSQAKLYRQLDKIIELF